jgi:parallel beta-helix repeat protein
VNGGIIFIKSGLYDIKSTIVVPSQTALIGEMIGYYASPLSTILRLANGANCKLLEAKGEDADGQSKNIVLKDIWFSGNASNQTAEVDMVDLTKGRAVYIDHCYFYGSKRDALIVYSAWVLNSKFMNCGRMAVNALTDNYLLGLDIGVACLDSAYAGYHAVWLGSGANFLGFSNIYSAKYGFGVTAYGSHMNVIVGNRISHNNRNGIYLYNANNNIIVGNKVHDNSQYGQNVFHGIDIGGTSANNIVVGNRCWNNDPSNMQGFGIRERDSANYNVIVGNVVRGNYQANGISFVGANTIVRSNVGFVTVNSGTATIAAGATSVTVAHGLAATPTKVIVTPRGNLGAVWVSARDATNITISCSTAPDADTIVDWYAEV